MNELFIYDLFKAIIQLSTVLEGRFFVVKASSDINESNYSEIIQDALGGLEDGRKYPAAVLLPPQEVVASYVKGWSTFRCVMFFLTLDGRTGINDIQAANYDALLSGHTMTEDWKDMRECAGDFRAALNAVTRQPSVISKLRPNSTNPDLYDRFSWASNDRLNGIRLSFDIDLFMPCEMADYPSNIASQVAIPADRHPIHKHS